MILQTKLFIPPLPAGIVPRDRLYARLDAGLAGKLTLIAAPAGFGKTTLVAGWIAGRDDADRFRWLALDEADNELSGFFRYVAAALAPLATEPLLLTQMSRADQSIPPRGWAHALINDALAIGETSKRPFTLILEDFHVIHNPAINEALDFFLDRMPAAMHLVLTSRADPNVRIARLRVRRELTEIRAADLRLDDVDVIELARQLALSLTAEQAALLNVRTEGWAAGLQLAALALQSPARKPDVDEFVRTFAGSHQFVMDYLTDEVLRGLPLEMESFLLQTAVLNRFNHALCTAVLADQRIDAAAVLQRLAQANLFLVPLDGQRRWYRYHHLFADLLRQRLSERFSAAHIAGLHRRAAGWLAAHDYVDETLSHGAIIDEWDAAAAAIVRLGTAQFNQGETARTRRWYERLPDHVVRANPQLALGQAWLHYTRLDIPGLLPYLEIAETVTDDPAHTGQAAILRALQMMTAGDVPGAVAYAEAADIRLAERFAAQKGGLNFLLGNAYDILNQTAERGAAFNRAVAYLERAGNWVGYSGALFLLIRHHQSAGDLQTAYRLGEEFMRRFAADPRLQHGGGAQALVVHALNILARHEAARFGEAETAVTRARDLTELTMPDTAIDVWIIITLAMIKLVRGEHEAARTLADQADETLQKLPAGGSIFGYYDFMVQLHLLLGRPARAERWITAFDTAGLPADAPVTHLNSVHRIAALLQSGLFDELQLLAGQDTLQSIIAVQSFGEVQLRAKVVLSLVQAARGDVDAAHRTLSAVVAQAAPQEWAALFQFPGDLLPQLLRDLKSQSPHRAFCERVLRAYWPESSSHPGKPASGLPEPLSDRELELLQLVAQGFSNREIAAHLFLAIGTVKRHLSNINGKLGAANRTQAVARARDLDLL